MHFKLDDSYEAIQNMQRDRKLQILSAHEIANNSFQADVATALKASESITTDSI